MQFKQIAFGASSVVLALALIHGWVAQAQGNANLDYTTSWIGNTLGGSNINYNLSLRHVPLNINDIYVTPDGRVFTNTPWEEGGRPVSVFKDGELTSHLNDLNNSPNWSNGGGVAVAAYDRYVYRSNAPNGTGVTVLNAGDLSQAKVSLTGSTTLSNSHGIFGMAVSAEKLYVTEDDMDRVEVFSLKTWNLVDSLAIQKPVRIAVDSAGGVWVSHRDETPLPSLNGHATNINGQMGLPVVDHYDSKGKWIDSISLPAGGEVGALWIDGSGRLLVGDDGPDQNIKVYGNIEHNPALVDTLGQKGGDYAGDVNERGKVGPWRFRGITGIATDLRNNLYVSESGFGLDMGVGHGTVLQSYNPQGRLNWSVDGLEFVSLASADPQSPTDVYDAYHHFKLDYSEPPGQEATYVADTYDRFRYPTDIRVSNIASTGQVAWIQGRKFLLVNGQYGVSLSIHRFDDSASGPGKEIAIPCVAFDYGSFQESYQDFAVEPLDGEFIWRDKNGDGQMSLDEFIEPPANSHRDGGYFSVDSNGDVWQQNYNANYEGSIHLRRYIFRGFDGNGAPIYDYDHMKIYDVPTDITGLADIQKAIFDASATDGGTLYVAGTNTGTGSFTQIVRYDHWDKGNRTPAWVANLPWDPDPAHTWAPNSFAVAGDYIFVDFGVPHYTVILSNKTGSYVGRFVPGADVGGLSNVGNDDEWQSISAIRRDDGEYIVFHEEDYQAKMLMYRWRPNGNLRTPAPPSVPSGLHATVGDETANLSWTAPPGALTYTVSRSNAPGGPYTVTASGVYKNNLTDTGLVNGHTYYYVVSALAETGESSVNSPELGVTAVKEGTTYEAENATLANGGGIYPCTQHCSGGARVGAATPGVTITFSNVVVPKAGSYAVRVYFTNGDSNPSDSSAADLTPNDGAPVLINSYPYTGDYNIPGYITVDVPLKAGANTLVLGVPATSPNGMPDVDRILVPSSPL